MGGNPRVPVGGATFREIQSVYEQIGEVRRKPEGLPSDAMWPAPEDLAPHEQAATGGLFVTTALKRLPGTSSTTPTCSANASTARSGSASTTVQTSTSDMGRRRRPTRVGRRRRSRNTSRNRHVAGDSRSLASDAPDVVIGQRRLRTSMSCAASWWMSMSMFGVVVLRIDGVARRIPMP